MADESAPSRSATHAPAAFLRALARLGPCARDAAGAVAAAMIALAVYAAQGFSSLAEPGGDNDSLLRMAQVRDLLAGQSWFDLTQTRMGPEGGFEMHWSRLVDAPIAGLVWLFTALTGDAALGEAIAETVWPLTLYAAALFLISRLARGAIGDRAVLPALAIGGIGLYMTKQFDPGSIDHHNVQVVLTLLMAERLTAAAGEGARAPVAACVAGAAAGLMLAIGMEALPYAAAGGLVAAGAFLLGGAQRAGLAARYGAGFAGAAALAFLATVPPGRWLVPVCDAYSAAQGASALIAGLGLAAIARTPQIAADFRRRFFALAALGAGLVLLAFVFFPQCLAGPYGDLDPRLKRYWLDNVTEAQSVFEVFAKNPIQFAFYYVPPMIGMLIVALRARGAGWRIQESVLGALMLAALATSFWQVRGALFSLALSTPALAGWAAAWRVPEGEKPTATALARMTLAWAGSLNLVWALAAAGALKLVAPDHPAFGDGEKKEACYGPAVYEGFAALPAGRVLAISNLGAPVLRHTHHRALAGPYHRNQAGNLAALDAFLGTPEEARSIARRHGVDYVLVCPGNGETGSFAGWAPGGFLARLAEGEAPDWLAPLPEASREGLVVYAVRDPQTEESETLTDNLRN
ncbi:hypothetical protein [Amphiplicatus metriothermophilus]|uniref:4-amino-4-deoxy-L-arabinose transferase n=1 Tax=Amphiplicatus metriothermophilus TaxID=1519374 RepID=A0A239PZK0_9PROT|nr:hypothetical protein [Amphiplicatus metriothermophilus]MBB5519852.1 hypothetical protein [Amphiplicatus metriothermophilus]SNT75097.1 hypothetical protein SAMN06297382_2539 [Amphiplicatus metriothermophilus]